MPVVGFVQVGAQSMADRYAYIPFWGLFIALVWAGYDLLIAAGKKQPASVAPLRSCASLHHVM